MLQPLFVSRKLKSEQSVDYSGGFVSFFLFFSQKIGQYFLSQVKNTRLQTF